MADVSGYAIQWGRPAIIGGLFEERIARGAFDKSIREHDVAALWAHDPSRPLGRTRNGSLTLRSDSIGLWYRLTPNLDAPSGQELLAAVARGDANEVSVGFYAIAEEWSDDDRLPRRLVTEADLLEISILIWGAYGDTTSASIVGASRQQRLAEREAAMRRRGIAL